MIKRFFLFGFVGSLFFLTSCAAHQQGVMEEGSQPQQSSRIKESDLKANINITYEMESEFQSQSIENKIEDRWEKIVLKKYSNSPFFKKTGKRIDKPDINIDVVVTFAPNPTSQQAQAEMIIFTLGLIPFPGTTNYELKADIFKQETGQIGTIRLEEGIKTYISWFLLPAMPFTKSPGTVEQEVQEKMAERLVNESVNRISVD